MILVADNYDLDLTLKEFDLEYTEAVQKATRLTEKFDTVIVCEHGKFQRY
jgi:hypothetical protein